MDFLIQNLAWIYEKFFLNHPCVGFAVISVIISVLVTGMFALVWFPSVDKYHRDNPSPPLIPPGAQVGYPPMPLFPLPTLSEQELEAELARLQCKTPPPLLVEIRGFGFQPRSGAAKNNEEIQRRLPGAGEITSTFSFPIVIVNKSTTQRVSLEFQSFRIIPGLGIDGAAMVLDSVETNLGPQEHTEGRISLQLEQSTYRHLTAANHLKILVIRDRISDRRIAVTIPTGKPSRNK